MPRDQRGWRVQPAPDGRGMPEQGEKPKPPHCRPGFLWFVLALFVLNWLSVLLITPSIGPERVTVAFNPFFLQTVQAGQVKSISTKGNTVEGTFKEKLRYPPSNAKATPTKLFKTEIPTFWNDAQLSALLHEKGVEINAHSTTAKTSLLLEILLGFGPTLLIVGLFVLLARRAAGGGAMGALGGFGRSRARRVDPETIRVTFDDVAGIDEAKAELTEIVDFLKNPERYGRLGGRMPHGVLLYGPPGTGTRPLARAGACASPRPADPTSRTPRSCGPGAPTGASPCSLPTATGGAKSSKCTRARSRSPTTLISKRSPRARPAWSERTSRTSPTRPRCSLRGAATRRCRWPTSPTRSRRSCSARRAASCSHRPTASAPPTTSPATRSSACSRPEPIRCARS